MFIKTNSESFSLVHCADNQKLVKIIFLKRLHLSEKYFMGFLIPPTDHLCFLIVDNGINNVKLTGKQLNIINKLFQLFLLRSSMKEPSELW